GHRIVELSSWSNAQAYADTWNKSYGQNWANHENKVIHPNVDLPIRGAGESRAHSENEGKGGSQSQTSTSGGHQSLTPEYEQFLELASRSYYTFEEQRSLWGQAV